MTLDAQPLLDLIDARGEERQQDALQAWAPARGQQPADLPGGRTDLSPVPPGEVCRVIVAQIIGRTRDRAYRLATSIVRERHYDEFAEVYRQVLEGETAGRDAA